MEVIVVIVVIILFWIVFANIIAPAKPIPPTVVKREFRPAPALVVEEPKVVDSPLQNLSKATVINRVKTAPVLGVMPEWFVGNFGIEQVSPAEQKIIDELSKYQIEWEREVSFRGFKLPTKGNARFDFYLVEHNIIIEYHGKDYHSSPERQEVDRIKKEFCVTHNIRLIELHSKHYYNMIETFQLLMRELKIPKK